MTIADQNSESHNGKKLEKSLDAVAALRQAMEQRLAAARIAQQAASSLALDELLVGPEDDDEEIDSNPELSPLGNAPETAVAPTVSSLASNVSHVENQTQAVSPFTSSQTSSSSPLTTSEAPAQTPERQASDRQASDLRPSDLSEARAHAIKAAAQDTTQPAADARPATLNQSEQVSPRLPGQEAPRQETPRSASPGAHPPNAESSHKASGHQVPPAPDTSRPYAARSDAPRADIHRTEAPRAEAHRAEAPQEDVRSRPVMDDPHPLTFDPIVWTRILIHVSEGCQKLIRDYFTRMRSKPFNSTPFTPTPIMESLSGLSTQFLTDPEAYTQAQIALWQNYLDVTRATIARLQGFKGPADSEAALDKRFKDKDWQNNWMFEFLKQSYLKGSDGARKIVQRETAQIDKKLARKIEFYTRLFLDATAPSNFWLTNPEVLRATLDSGGENLIRGFGNLLEDLESGNGMLRIRMSDYHAFEIGKNIATTPGKVIFQNDLMQLIQYSPSTETVRRVPVLIVPPWINKYYILDLREKNSYIRYLVGQGYTVFCISWVNPTKRHALTQFEDYVDKGAVTALRQIKKITGEDEINTIGYCIGGTALACTQAYIEAHPEPLADLPKIKSATYLVTMIDFSNPGDLGVFIDEDQIRMLEDRMARQGYMDAGSMMLTFNLLRANDLIWPFVINNYLLGREPFPFDILYWNTDSTNLPAAMQSYYLRKMYLDNKLIEPDALKMKGMPIDLREIKTPSFILATRDDHIAPWRSTYAATQIYGGPVTFVLSGSGHIAGVVNPPAAEKYGYWTNAECPSDPEDWVKNAQSHSGSWWPEWVKWLEPFAGESIPARIVGEGLEDAPGSYVKIRAV